ncbi:hypothetical protein M1146_03470, partial [Patescibacteria group bacterium]|nr:hypothetical protein [Patescibacteria group bacterium]
MNSPKEVKSTRKHVKVLKDKNDTQDANFNPPKEISHSTPKRTLSEDFSRPSKIQRSPIQRSPNPQPNRTDSNYNVFNLQDVLKLSPFQQSQPLHQRPLRNNRIEQGQQTQQVFLQNISQAQQQKQEQQRPNNNNNNNNSINNNIKQKANNKKANNKKANNKKANKQRQKQQEQ